MTDALKDLLAKVDAGDATRTEVEDAAIPAIGADRRFVDAGAAYNGSLDAAKALHDAVLPGWTWELGTFTQLATVYAPGYPGDDFDAPCYDSEHKVCSRAWLIAILKALIAEASE